MAQSLQISLSNSDSSSTSERRFVHLTQPIESGMDKTASMYDISQMISRASSGNSAHTYKKNECSAGITEDNAVNVRLDFDAWPSSPDLAYTLEASIGNISLPTIIDEYTEFSIIFGSTDVVELDFILSSLVSYKWETSCYTPQGVKIINPPVVTMDGLTTMRCDKEVFGVIRVVGKKVGASHTVTHSLLKSYPIRPDEPIPDEGITSEDIEKYWAYTDVATWNGEPVDSNDTINATGLSLTNLAITITAKWINLYGDEETESMRLTVPQCVQDLLSLCDGDLDSFGGSHSGTSICDLSDSPEQLTVYISGCTGKVLEERSTKDDPDSWCE